MKSALKILRPEELANWREAQRQLGHCVGAVNGCFDLLHFGHALALEQAKSLVDVLIVGINSDESIQARKGPGRPVFSEHDRAFLLASLEVVDAVTVFQGSDASEFLAAVRPDYWIRGYDYKVRPMNKAEHHAVRMGGGRDVYLPERPAGRSSTQILRSLQGLEVELTPA